MNRKKVFLIVGRTSTGKSSITRKVAEKLNLQVLKSYTDRPRRNGETDDVADHIFLTKDEANRLLEDKENIVAYTEGVENNYRYFCTTDQILTSDFYVIDPSGVEYLKHSKISKLSDVDFIEVYIRVPYTMQKHNASIRGTSASFESRYEQESSQFSQYEKNAQFHYHVLNNTTLDEACDKLEQIVKKELNDDTRTGR